MSHQTRHGQNPRLTLVSMPWQSLETPCLAIGVLKQVARDCGLVDDVQEVLGGMRWIEFLMEDSQETVQPADYTFIAENGLFHGVGDWVFAGALYDDSRWRVAEFRSYLERYGADAGLAFAMRPLAGPFVDLCVEEILASRPDVVGFSSTFMQNVPSLAVAKRLKRRDPDLVVVLGGANCDGEMGAALQREFPFLDYCVSGEGERALPELLEVVTGARDPATVLGLSYWRDGRQQVNLPRRHATPPTAIPVPDFDTYFEEFARSPVRHYVEPKLLLESARGCWWGEAHHCTFCGLNGSVMQFRSKPADVVFAELEALVRRHGVLDVIVADNIIDNTYYESLLPLLAEAGWDLRLHYEIKSNIRPRHAERLRDARVANVQPGIESLLSTVLKLMDKGVSGTHNVEALRELESASLTVSWNWLYGFPGEKDEDYYAILDQLPLLYHLQPPGGASRIALQRFSPNFEDPSMGFAERRAAELYGHLYDVPEPRLSGFAYMFDTPAAGIGEEAAGALESAIAAWMDAYPRSVLFADYRDGAVEVYEGRVGRPAGAYVVDDPVEVHLLQELRRAGRAGRLERLVGDLPDAGTASVEAALDKLVSLGLVFSEGDRLVSLPTSAMATKVA